jgi:hypothetical protein
MAKNKITDLRDHLFAQLERLGDDADMKNPIKREAEIDRSKAIVSVSKAITETAKVEISFLKALKESGKNGMDVSFIPAAEQKQLGAAAPEKNKKE